MSHRTLSSGHALTIVGYHYVRPIRQSRYPALKGREVEDFRSQLRYFDRYYTFVSIEDVVASTAGGPPLPARPLLLTFDDGYKDHYAHAFPALHEFGIRGAFYPTTDAVLEHRVLAANKIQFILASISDPTILVEAIERGVAAAPEEMSALPVADYRSRYWISNRFDPEPVLYCKQLLQHALPDPLRSVLVDELFRRFVTEDEASFAAELYVNVSELQDMVGAGMHVGGHGGTHAWLDRLPAHAQQDEIEGSLRLLRAVWRQEDVPCLTFCYPYGGYNADTLAALRQKKCRVGLTVRPDLAYLERDPILELPRLDTTDLPVGSNDAPGIWTVRAQTESIQA